MSLDTFVAGRYSGTYNAVDTGVTEEGYEIEQDSKAELIENTDAYGDAIVDWIYRGGNCRLSFLSDTYKAGAITPFWPWTATLGQGWSAAAPIGRLASAVAQAMVLTAIAGTPAAAAPASVTATLSLLAPNSPAKLLYHSRLRKVQINLQVLPNNSSGTYSWFV
jgi:hypothetical protein